VGVQGCRYCIIVRGKSHSEVPSVLGGTSIETHDDVTALTVDVRDSSHLCGLLDRLRDLAVDIVSVDVAPAIQESNEAAGGKAAAVGPVP
jgi:23S rRNA U2552 (ribose-2'-O)-methylase RlmE/FtsJ